MQTGNWLASATALLETAGIGTARLDSLILLEDELGQDRSYLLAHPEHTLQSAILKRLGGNLKRRAGHEPLAYIRGFSEFYGRRFIVTPDILEPRPESEAMIKLLKELAANYRSLVAGRLIIADIGTGSGALAITAKLEVPEAEVFASDIEPKCLAVARKNAKKFQAKITFRQGDLLEPLKLGTKDWRLEITIVLANLPYVPNRYKINRSASLEPKTAIFGGPDGLDVYRRLFGCLAAVHAKPLYVLTESLPSQHQSLSAIAEIAGFKTCQTNGFVQVFESMQ